MRSFALTFDGKGRIDAFYIRPDSSMGHLYNGPSWEGENQLGLEDRLGGVFRSAPTATYSVRPHLTLPPVVVGPKPVVSEVDAAEGAAPQVNKLPPPVIFKGPPTPCMDVFGLGTDYALYHQALWNGKPSGDGQWENLGGVFISTPTAIAWGGRTDVFGLGTDRAMYQRTLTGQTWSSGWSRMGGMFSSEATAVSWGPARLDVFVRDVNFQLRHLSFDGTQWIPDWQDLGGTLASPPAAVSWAENRLDVIAVSTDGTMVHKWWDGMIWNEWESLGVPGNSLRYVDTPSAVSWGVGRIDVFNMGSDGNLYHLWLDGGQWQGPENMGGDVSATCTALTTGAGELTLMKSTAAHKINVKTYKQTWSVWQQVPWPLKPMCRYKFSLDRFKCDNPRSLNADTDVASATLTVGGWSTLSGTNSMGDVGGTHLKQGQFNLSFSPVLVETCEHFVFSYQILNSGAGNAATVLDQASKQLADEAVSGIKKALNAGVTAITGIEIATVTAVPVIGPILAILGGWLIGKLTDIAFARCDGLVAVEMIVVQGDALQRNTAAGPWSVTTVHPGTDSATGCGANSKYEVTWSISQI